MRTMRPPGWKIAAVLLVGILAISFGSILVRLALRASGDQSLAFSLVMSAGRLALAALLLAPGWTRPLEGRAGLPFALAAGGFLALHFAFWITSLSYTSVAASTALVTTNPVWVTLLGWWLFGERPSFLTLLGVGVALLGGVLIGLGDSEGGGGANPLLGDFLALLGAVAASCYFLLGREAQRRGLSTWAYVRVAYTAAALLLLPLPYLFGGGYGGIPSRSTPTSSSWPSFPSSWATPASTGPPATSPRSSSPWPFSLSPWGRASSPTSSSGSSPEAGSSSGP